MIMFMLFKSVSLSILKLKSVRGCP